MCRQFDARSQLTQGRAQSLVTRLPRVDCTSPHYVFEKLPRFVVSRALRPERMIGDCAVQSTVLNVDTHDDTRSNSAIADSTAPIRSSGLSQISA